MRNRQKTKTLLSTSGYEKVSCKEECSPTFHFCLLAVSSWLQTSRSDRVWPSSRRRSARTRPPQPPLTGFLLPHKRLHNCKEPEQFVCFSFSKLPISLSCVQLYDVFPSGQGSTESQRFIHKPMESLIKKFHISQALFSIIQTAAWSQVR